MSRKGLIYCIEYWCFETAVQVTLDERYTIEHMLNDKNSFKAIAKEITRDCTTISKEIRIRLIFVRKGSYGRSFNDCKNRAKCTHTYLCKLNCRYSKCSNCTNCHIYCDDYEQIICSKLLKFPYVCNGCKKNSKCTMERRYYKAIKAHKEYASLLKECRSGINITENHLSSINEIASPLIDKGQSVYHIWVCNKDTLMVSEKTLYNYINSCLLTAKNIDLPRKVKFKPKKKASKILKVDTKCRIGRTFEDFKTFCTNNPDLPIVEIDTVEGVKGGKLLLAIIFRNCNLLLAFNTSQSVIDIFNKLDKPLGRTNFMKLFPVIVTDYTEKKLCRSFILIIAVVYDVVLSSA